MRISICSLVAGLCVALHAFVGQAAIVTVGDVVPPHPFPYPDPWLVGGPLTVADTADGVMTVNGGSDVINSLGTIGDAVGCSGLVTIDGDGSSWTNDGVLYVGYDGSATMSVKHGGSVDNTYSWIGYGPTGTGTVTVAGIGSTWENTADLSLGIYRDSGVGELTISGGGTVYVGDAASDGTAGDLTISSSDDVHLPFPFGSGQLTVYNGSTLTHGGDTVIGDDADEFGWVTVAGIGSSWTNSGELAVGSWGTGELTVSGGTVSSGELLYVGLFHSGEMTVGDGGSVSNTDALVGFASDATGVVTVTGSGSSWTSSESLSVAVAGTSTLSVQQGASVSNVDGWVGYYTGGTGTVTVTGDGSVWENTGDLSLGTSSDSGVGALTISNGGTLYIGDAASDGTAGQLVISDSNGSGSSGGQLYLYNGSTLNHGDDAVVGDDVGEFGWATVNGIGSAWTNSGELAVGSSGSGALTVQSGGEVSNGGWLYVGLFDSGTLIVQSGASVTNTDGLIGFANGANGTATVTGTDSSWTNNGSLSVGFAGSGTLNVQTGGSVSNTHGRIGEYTGGTGTVMVTGAGATWKNIGSLSLGSSSDSGVGTLTISNGGTVYVGNAASSGGTAGQLTISDYDRSGENGGHLYIYNGSTVTHDSDAVVGDDVGEFGWATVDGTESSWTNAGELAIGSSGSGTLTVKNGGTVSSADFLYVGISASGSLTVETGGTVSSAQSVMAFAPGSMGAARVEGIDSSWTNSGSLYVGGYGAATLDVLGGGRVSSSSGWLAYYAGGTAMVTIDGAGSTWTNTESLSVGYDGSATLAVQNGGMLTTDSISLGHAGAGPSTGTLRIDGGTLEVTDSLLIDQTGHVDFFEGMIRANQIDDLYGNFNWMGGALTIGSFEGDLHNPSGHLVPGLSPGLATVLGDYIQGNQALLAIELVGTDEHDQLHVASTVSLAGTLQLQPLTPYVDPTQSGTVDIFEIILAGDLEGTFEAITYDGTLLLPNFLTATTFRSYQGDGLFRVLRYLDDSVIYANYRALPGDANGDGVVDGQDFIIWNSHKFTSGTDWTTGDFTGDGITDGQDFIAWNSNKFTSVPAFVANVPESQLSTRLLWCCLLVTLVQRWRWDRRAI